MRAYAGICLIVVLLTGCNYADKTEDVFPGSWSLQDFNVPIGDTSYDRNTKLINAVYGGTLLSFFNDNTYSLVTGEGNYHYGSWKIEGTSNKIRLTSNRGTNEELRFGIEKDKRGTENLILVNYKNGVALKYGREWNRLEKSEDDPFHYTNNKWRIRPAITESPDEVRKRLSMYLRHVSLILKAAKDRKQNIVYFKYSKGPVQIYSSAVGIYPYDEVPDFWKNTFYNDSGAVAAYSLYSRALLKSSYKGKSAGNWVDDDYNILQAVLRDIQKIKVNVPGR